MNDVGSAIWLQGDDSLRIQMLQGFPNDLPASPITQAQISFDETLPGRKLAAFQTINNIASNLRRSHPNICRDAACLGCAGCHSARLSSEQPDCQQIVDNLS
ncbi:MAG TPA: hypothetical protein VFV06_00725 [Sphingorhabdus sp.]|nr:hypothetical protein [Sphingorhabdus sp.]